jgi:hypothetical protein
MNGFHDYEVMSVDLLDEWEHAEIAEGIDHEDAAVTWFEDSWDGMDYPDRMSVVVRLKGGDGRVVAVDLWAEPSTSFRSRVRN